MKTALAVMLVVACSSTSTTGSGSIASSESTSSACRAAITAFATADYKQLRELPAGCTFADVEAALGRERATSSGNLAGRAMPFGVHHFGPNDIRAWIEHEQQREVDGHEKLVLLDAEWTAAASAAAYLAFGEPDARLDVEARGVMHERALLVYAKRGVVIVTTSDARGLGRVGVFAPMTLVEYEQKLRYGEIDTD